MLLPLGTVGPLAAEKPNPAETTEFTPEERSHWAFQPVSRPPVPTVANGAALRNAIDSFLLASLKSSGLAFSPEAARPALIRRATLDLLGLPPTPEEVERFLADESPDAYERLIDRLLDSPHYGEAFGRDWLDLVRFAETAGFNADPVRPLAWKYRDYVIRALNGDIPYDQFVAQQIAGDEMFPDQADALIATGYNRMWPDESNSSDVFRSRQEALNDLTANVGSVFLGLSIGCAQCHDHKFDPLPQRDFYRLQAFFAGIVPRDKVAVGSQEALDEYQSKLRVWLDETAALRNELRAIEATARARAGAEKRKKFPEAVLKAIDTAPESRTALQHQYVFWSDRQIIVSDKDFNAQLSNDQKERRNHLRKLLAKLNKDRPKPPAEMDAMATVDISGERPKTFLLAGGSYAQPMDELQPGYLSILEPTNDAETKPVATPLSNSRRDLVKWIVDPANPLASRVIANRLWQTHFGRGLVENANDFGIQTPPPSHPELLDWLASELVTRGWSLKAMHRLIMTSTAYRQGAGSRNSELTQTAIHVDPGNTLYWHYPRRRLSAERIRDAMLAVSGRLSSRMEGPGVRPPLPAALGKRDAWKVSESTTEQDRRSVYIYAKRNLPFPLLQAFDSPDMHESCARRESTTIAPQALFLLNSDDTTACAAAFAERVTRGISSKPDETPSNCPKVARAYLLAFGRMPHIGEARDAVDFLKAQTASENNQAAVIDFCHALLNSNEFLFIE
ncbi:MAG: DUF1549 and DUF1553 domain-containing protein [Planctomycetaceae bacterium]